MTVLWFVEQVNHMIVFGATVDMKRFDPEYTLSDVLLNSQPVQ